MDANEKLNLLKQKNREIEKLKSESYEISRTLFDEWSKDFFERNEKVDSFSWNQYTPYFNDGDTCVFSANTDYIKVNGEYAEECEWMNENIVTNWGTYNRETRKYEGRVEVPNSSYDAELSKAVGEIQDFLCNFDNDFFMSRFGDHTEITVSREGIEVEDYEHD
jgi:hypothetical protein